MDEKQLVICEAYDTCDYNNFLTCDHRHVHSWKCINTCEGKHSNCPYMEHEHNKIVNCRPVEEVIDESERRRLSSHM